MRARRQINGNSGRQIFSLQLWRLKRQNARAIAPVSSASILAGCSDVQSTLNPESPDAFLIATLSWAMFAVAALVFLVTMAFLLAGILKARRRPGSEPLSSRRSWALVLAGGIAAPTAAIFAVVASGLYIGSETAAGPTGVDMTVEVIGKRWWWEIHYLDKAGEPIAVTANEIHLPAEERTRILLRSDNVIHSFWAPNLQGKTDLIPGKVNATWIEPRSPGIYRGQCAEFCGTQHAFMAFLVIVEEEEDFRDWLANQARPAPPLDDEALLRGRAVFMEVGCARCHTIRGTEADGEIGPDLTHLASRQTLAAATIPNTRGNLGGWITDPQHVKPGALMPPLDIRPADLQLLLAYLASLE